jgi:hypothetical protein
MTMLTSQNVASGDGVTIVGITIAITVAVTTGGITIATTIAIIGITVATTVAIIGITGITTSGITTGITMAITTEECHTWTVLARIVLQLAMESLASVQPTSVVRLDGVAAGAWSGTLLVATMLDVMADIAVPTKVDGTTSAVQITLRRSLM